MFFMFLLRATFAPSTKTITSQEIKKNVPFFMARLRVDVTIRPHKLSAPFQHHHGRGGRGGHDGRFFGA